MKIAVVGSGIAGLGAAWALSRRHDVTLYEAEQRLGGHARTIDAVVGDRLVTVDTGFIVYNERNYPNLTALFAHHGVATEATVMSFSVSGEGFEYATTIGGLLAGLSWKRSRRSLAIARGISRFRRSLRRGDVDADATLGEHLRGSGYPEPFIIDYLLPLAATVWSGSARDAADMHASTLMRFLANHGLFDLPRPRWRTVAGGSREYVDRLAKEITRVHAGTPVSTIRRTGDGAVVMGPHGGERYDHVVLATHAPTSLAILDDATDLERSVLRHFRYAPNRAVVHGDASFMPRRRRAWASWNAAAGDEEERAPMTVTYWMNRLQRLDDVADVFVTLNPLRQPQEVIDDVWFSHPQFTPATLRAQRRLPAIQGNGGVWFCGAWTGNGFHEDGLQSALTVAAALGAPAPWHDELEPMSPAAVNAAPRQGRR